MSDARQTLVEQLIRLSSQLDSVLLYRNRHEFAMPCPWVGTQNPPNQCTYRSIGQWAGNSGGEPWAASLLIADPYDPPIDKERLVEKAPIASVFAAALPPGSLHQHIKAWNAKTPEQIELVTQNWEQEQELAEQEGERHWVRVLFRQAGVELPGQADDPLGHCIKALIDVGDRISIPILRARESGVELYKAIWKSLEERSRPTDEVLRNQGYIGRRNDLGVVSYYHLGLMGAWRQPVPPNGGYNFDLGVEVEDTRTEEERRYYDEWHTECERRLSRWHGGVRNSKHEHRIFEFDAKATYADLRWVPNPIREVARLLEKHFQSENVIAPSPATSNENNDAIENGPVEPFGFRWDGIEIKLTKSQHRLVTALWDVKRSSPRDSCKDTDVYTAVWGDSEGHERPLATMCSETRNAFRRAAIPLNIRQDGGKTWIEIIP